LLAPIREHVRQLVANLVVDDAGNADAAGFGERLETCGDIDAVAKDVAVIGRARLPQFIIVEWYSKDRPE